MKVLKGLIYLLLLLPITTKAQDTKSTLLGITEITVKQGHDAQFIEGVKLYKECYLKNKGTDHWNVWHRVQGKGNVYVLTGPMAKWADMDKKDPAGDACRSTVTNFIMPNVESIEYNIAQTIPEFSMERVEGTKLISVYFFNVKNSTDFNEVIKGVSTAMKTTDKTSGSYWYTLRGGTPDGANYFVTTPYKGFADLDIDRDGVWKIYEKVNGLKATDALRTKFRGAVEKSWSYLYTLSEDLSN
ncbi:MAG: hypothetical protein ABIP35_01115 [Ginsengibacter sp.]